MLTREPSWIGLFNAEPIKIWHNQNIQDSKIKLVACKVFYSQKENQRNKGDLVISQIPITLHCSSYSE